MYACMENISLALIFFSDKHSSLFWFADSNEDKIDCHVTQQNGLNCETQQKIILAKWHSAQAASVGVLSVIMLSIHAESRNAECNDAESHIKY